MPLTLPKLYKPGEIVKVEIPNAQITRDRSSNWLTSGSVDFSRINLLVSKVEEKREINGVSRKPLGCSSCSYRSIGSGFVPDYRGKNAKIAICLEAPGEEEYLRSMPLVGKAGRYWLRTLIEPLGYGREDVLICNSIRCRPPGNNYPTGKLRKEAESSCRQYDDKLRAFNPNLFVVSLHPSALLRSSAATRLVRKDVEKAFNFAKEGYRPFLLMGEKALEIFSSLRGIKKWRGTFWLQSLYDEKTT